MVCPPYTGATYIRFGGTGSHTTTATMAITDDFEIYLPAPECLDFTEEKECNEDERVVCKGTSTRRELKKLPNRTGYKARKEFWR